MTPTLTILTNITNNATLVAAVRAGRLTDIALSSSSYDRHDWRGNLIPRLSEDIDWADLRDDADEVYDDGMGNVVYRFGDHYLHDSEIGDVVVNRADSPAEYFAGWDHDSYGTPEDLLEAFGLTPDLDEADETHTGPCRIWCDPEYFESATAPLCHWVRDGDNDIEIWDNYADARAWVDERYAEPFVTASGQATRPTYTICKA